MTATQHSSAATEVDSLPAAIRQMEAAEPGDLAYAEGGSPCAMKMEPDSGRPWLLDPWGHEGTPSRVTTAMLAQMGYRVTAHETARREQKAPDETTFALHVEELREAGWTPTALAKASGASRTASSVALSGKHVSLVTRRKILTVNADAPFDLPRPSRVDQVENVEWLIADRVAPFMIAERCGYANTLSAAKEMRKAGRPDLAAYFPSYSTPEPATDEYDPYTDPTFKEEA